MKEAYRRAILLTVVLLSAFLVVSGLRMALGGKGLLDFLRGTGPDTDSFKKETYTYPEHAPLTEKDVDLLSRLNSEYAKVTEVVKPSVVSISTAGVGQQRVRDARGRVYLRPQNTQGQGSGVIVTHEGHVVTNYHVVANKQRIQVFVEGVPFEASVIGQAPSLDIAVLKIAGKGDFIPLKFGDSDQVQVGNIVLAVGNPFGIGKSVTNGIISAKERSLSDTQSGLFQTSAAINPGNSGGPLVNIKGEIVGINSAIYSSDERNPGFQGIGFAIPSNTVKKTLDDILERGRPIRGFLGIHMTDLTDRQRKVLGYDEKHGALVDNVGPETPADKAGIRAGDIIMRYGDKPITSIQSFIKMVQGTKVGEAIDIQIWRGGKEHTLVANIAEYETARIASMPSELNQQEVWDRVLGRLGVTTEPLGVSHRRHGYTGVMVTKVEASGIAAANIQPGDIIYSVHGNRVHTPEQFEQHMVISLCKQDTNVFLLRRVRGGRQAYKVMLPKVTY